MNKKIILVVILISVLGLVAKSQIITLTSSPSVSYCAGSSLVVSFTVSGTVWYSDNNFKLQLSNALGSFTTPSDIGTLKGTGNGSIVAIFPKTAIGANYKVRILSTNSVQTSNESSAFSINGIPNAPAVSSPVSYTQCASANPLSATASAGNTLLWLDGTNNSIGGTDFYPVGTNLQGITNPNENKATVFSTLVSNVTITSVDYTIPAYQEVSSLTLGLFNSSGSLIATSTTTTTLKNNTALPVKVTSLFNFLITTAGSYSIGAASGQGNVGFQNSPALADEPTNSIKITGFTNGGRLFNNIVFNLGIPSSAPPIPSTTTIGSKVYFVKQQSANGCLSDAAPITVNIQALAKPTVTTPINYTQYFASPAALVATPAAGATLYWSNSINGTYTTTPIIPPTTVIGSTTYFVKQMVGSCLSSAESIVVTITSMAPPDVSPVNYCLNATAVPLTATLTVAGATLNWSTLFTASIGNTATSGNNYTDAVNTGSIRKTFFKTLKTSVQIVSIDFRIPPNNLTTAVLGLYDSSDALLATSSTNTSGLNGGANGITVTNMFNYTIVAKGIYHVKLISGSGPGHFQTYATTPLTEPSGTIEITNASNGRIYGNIVFKTGGALSSAPTPLTTVSGTTSYYVSQIKDGFESPRAQIDVVVGTTTVPTVTGTTPASRCGPGTVMLSATISGGTANWYASATGGTSLSSGLNFTTPNLNSTTTYYVEAINGSCTSARTPVTATINISTWTGNVSSVWSNSANWNSCGVPAVGAAVNIPNVTTNNPVLGSPIEIGDLTLAAGAKISLNGQSLTIARQLGSGVISSTPLSSLTVTGTTDLNFDQTTPQTTNSLKNLTINATGIATLSNALNVFEELKITAGTLASGAGMLTLKSSETATAYVSTITAVNSGVTGTVNVERFMKGGSNSRRGYRLMSSPVVQTATQYNVSNLMQNMYITGAGGATNGFDPSPNNGATVYKYNEGLSGAPSQRDYTPISSPTELFNKGQGMYLFYRGLKNPTDANGTSRFSTLVVPEDNVVSFNGSLIQGDVFVNLSYTATPNDADGFNLVGNPYASTIDLNSAGVTATLPAITSNFYVLNPTTKVFDVYSKTSNHRSGITIYR